MLFAAAGATLVMLRTQGGFGGQKGFPFAWMWWPDVVIDGRVPAQFHWLGLAADVAIWFALILGLGISFESVTKRIGKRRLAKDDA